MLSVKSQNKTRSQKARLIPLGSTLEVHNNPFVLCCKVSSKATLQILYVSLMVVQFQLLHSLFNSHKVAELRL